MTALAIKSELESRGVSTDTFIENNELIDALLKIRREEEKRDVVLLPRVKSTKEISCMQLQ